jgi:hypothetical protein
LKERRRNGKNEGKAEEGIKEKMKNEMSFIGK